MAEAQNEDVERSDRSLDFISLNELIKRAKVVDKIYSTALKVGFTDTSASPYDPDDDEVESESQTISRLLQICIMMGIHSTQDLLKKLKKVSAKDLIKYFSKQIADRENDDTWYVSKAFILIIVLLYLHPEKISSDVLVEQLDWDKKVAERTINVAKGKV